MTMLDGGEPVLIIISVIENGVFGTPYVLPVSPERIDAPEPQGLRRDRIINVGEVVSFEIRKPREINFSSFFPAQNDTYVNYLSLVGGEVEPPVDWLRRIRTFHNKTLQVVIPEMAITGQYKISDFRPYMQGGVGAEIGYDISFVQHQQVQIRAVGQSNAIAGTLPRALNIGAHEYVPKLSDNLAKIAQKVGLSPERITELNKVGNIQTIEAGKPLTIRSNQSYVVEFVDKGFLGTA